MPEEDGAAAYAIEIISALVLLIAYITIHVYAVQYLLLQRLVLTLGMGIALIFLFVVVCEVYGHTIHDTMAGHEMVRIVRLVGYPILVILFLYTLGINVTSLLVGAGFLGIVVGLAAQTTLGNVFAGLTIFYSRPFRKGDKISFSPPSYSSMTGPSYPHDAMIVQITGTIRSIGLMYTIVIRDDMTTIYVPNSVLVQSLVQNFSRGHEKVVRIRLEVERYTNVKLFRRLMLKEISQSKDQELKEIKDLEINVAGISTPDSLGILISARVRVLTQESVRQKLIESAIEVLSKVERSPRSKRRR